jgi:hypothetical protein
LPHGIADARFFQLDDIGAEVTQQLAAEGTSEQLPCLENSQVREGAGVGAHRVFPAARA